MGVKTLWQILEENSACFQNVRPPDLRRLVLAVDVSGWIFQNPSSTSISWQGAVPYPHLRLAFSRISLLLRNQCIPVFVIEGTAPSLKLQTLTERAQQKGNAIYKPKVKSGPTGKTREICNLLDVLGVPWLQAAGEAEATCAWLNQSKLVDGCITEDGDAFLFGATTIFRHFSADQSKDIMRYDMSRIQEKMGLDREKMIALALLVGCDYTDGVKNVGKENAMKLCKEHPGEDLISRFRSWKTDESFSEVQAYETLKKPTHCGKCGHLGSQPLHKKSGCSECYEEIGCLEGDECPCDWHEKQKIFQKNKVELRIRRHALQTPGFPFENVIREFRNPNVTRSSVSFTTQRPDYAKFQNFMKKYNILKPPKIMEQWLELCTVWDMANKSGLSVPECIVKRRQQHFEPMYEVKWAKIDGLEDTQATTMVHQEMMKDAFPELVEEYEAKIETIAAKKRSSKEKMVPSTPPKNHRIDDMFKQVRRKIVFPEIKDEERTSHPHPNNFTSLKSKPGTDVVCATSLKSAEDLNSSSPEVIEITSFPSLNRSSLKTSTGAKGKRSKKSKTAPTAGQRSVADFFKA